MGYTMQNGGDEVDTSPLTTPSQAVVHAVAEAEGVAATELGPPEYAPLHDVIDPEALDALFRRKQDGRQRTTGSVSFTYCEYLITVEASGSVSVE